MKQLRAGCVPAGGLGTLRLMLRLKPLAWWVVPWGLLAGLLLTLAFLGNMDFRNLPGCRQTVYGPRLPHSLATCDTIDEGYPVRFLSSYPYLEQDRGRTSNLSGVDIGGVPVINKGGLAEDWLVWSLVSCLALYIVSPAKPRQYPAFDAPAAGSGHPFDRST